MGLHQSSLGNERNLQVKDAISGYPHAYLTFILDMIFPKWAVRMWVDNTMWGKRLSWKSVEELARNFSQRGIFINRTLFSGSATEGLSLPSMFFYGNNKICESDQSDTDELLVDYERFLAVDIQHAYDTNCHLVIDTRHTHPGFVRIHVLDVTKEKAKYCIQSEVDGKSVFYLSSEIKWDITERLTTLDGEAVITGPALTQDRLLSLTQFGWTVNSIKSRDNVYAIRCRKWPKIAELFFSRQRASGWPPLETRQAILDYGIHVVGVPHKFSSDPSIEWRLSYSAAEVYLAYTLTLDQRHVYVILKYLSKAFLKGIPGFSSYLLKTTFFWVCEEIPQNMWKTVNLSVNLLAILDKMVTFIAEGHIPNYFIPQSNLIGHLSPEHMETLLTAIINLRKDPLKIIDAQQNMMLVFHSFTFQDILSPFGNDLPGIVNMIVPYGFRPIMRITERIVLFYAYTLHFLENYYCATNILENYLRHFWLSQESKLPDTFEIAHKRRQLYHDYCREREQCRGMKRNTFSPEDYIKVYSEGACRIDDTNGLFLRERLDQWEPLMTAISNEWFSQYSGNKDYLKDKLKDPTREFFQQAKLNEDDLPFYLCRPTRTQLYPPLEDSTYHKAIMRACQASWHLVLAIELEACDTCFKAEIKNALDAFKNALSFAKHDPCVMAEYSNLLLYLSSHNIHDSLGNLLLPRVVLIHNNKIQDYTVADLNEAIVQFCTEDPNIEHKFHQAIKTFSKHEIPALEANLADLVRSQDEAMDVPYDIYKTFLQIILLVRNDAKICDIHKKLIFLSKRVRELDALLINRARLPLLKSFNLSKSRSMIYYLHGLALLYCRRHVEAYQTLCQASVMYPACHTYTKTAMFILALMIWEHLSKRCTAVVLYQRDEEKSFKNVKLFPKEASNKTALKGCSCQKDYNSDSETASDNESLVNDAVQRLQHKYDLDSDLDSLTFYRAYLDMMTVSLPVIFDLAQNDAPRLSTATPLNDFELD